MSTSSPVPEKEVVPAAAAPAAASSAAEPGVSPTSADDAQADADFEGGFKVATDTVTAEKTGAEPPARVKPPEKTAAAPQKKPAAVEPAKPAAAAAETLHFGLTETELKARLDKVKEFDGVVEQLRKVNGHIGALQQALKAVKETPAGTPVKLSRDVMKKLVEQGYGELVDALVEDLNGVNFGSAPSTFNQAEYDKKVTAMVEASSTTLEKTLEKRLLTRDHPDWPQIYASTDFKEWKATLPPEVQTELETSWESDFLSKGLKAFKAWREKKAAPPAKEKEKEDKDAKRRLEANVPVKGDATAAPGTPDEDAMFEQGFKEGSAGR